MRRLVWGLHVARPNHPAMTRDQLLIGLGWAGALRASELVALDVADVNFVGDPDRADGGLIIHIRSSKTDQHHAGDVVGIPYATSKPAAPSASPSATAAGCAAAGQPPHDPQISPKSQNCRIRSVRWCHESDTCGGV